MPVLRAVVHAVIGEHRLRTTTANTAQCAEVAVNLNDGNADNVVQGVLVAVCIGLVIAAFLPEIIAWIR